MPADKYRVFLWDMPGHGASITQPSPPVNLVHQHARLAALIEHRHLSRPNVVAHDIGGAVAFGAHLLEGCEFASLYRVDVVTLDPCGSPFFHLVPEHEHAFSGLPSNLHAVLVQEYVAGAAGTGLDAMAQPCRSPEGQAAFYRQITQLSPSHTLPLEAPNPLSQDILLWLETLDT